MIISSGKKTIYMTEKEAETVTQFLELIYGDDFFADNFDNGWDFIFKFLQGREKGWSNLPIEVEIID